MILGISRFRVDAWRNRHLIPHCLVIRIPFGGRGCLPQHVWGRYTCGEERLRDERSRLPSQLIEARQKHRVTSDNRRRRASPANKETHSSRIKSILSDGGFPSESRDLAKVSSRKSKAPIVKFNEIFSNSANVSFSQNSKASCDTVTSTRNISLVRSLCTRKTRDVPFYVLLSRVYALPT